MLHIAINTQSSSSSLATEEWESGVQVADEIPETPTNEYFDQKYRAQGAAPKGRLDFVYRYRECTLDVIDYAKRPPGATPVLVTSEKGNWEDPPWPRSPPHIPPFPFIHHHSSPHNICPLPKRYVVALEEAVAVAVISTDEKITHTPSRLPPEEKFPQNDTSRSYAAASPPSSPPNAEREAGVKTDLADKIVVKIADLENGWPSPSFHISGIPDTLYLSTYMD
ncbi:hypothetical protein V5O48_004608 [Marasmius crinis-equi]|uniref:Uncharacterized protein n=1 Tax=Marasmius crinis-equi TaxID=585013 RepID=A0ABR3FPI2_9AGAR